MKLTFGQIKFYAHQYIRGIPVPIFADNEINRKINRHINKIKKTKTRRRKDERDCKSRRFDEL